MDHQEIKSQQGEIEFRKKLVHHQVLGQNIFNDEFDAKGIEEILSERMKKTVDHMTLLKELGIVLSPYIEIGAERCQRSLVMENDLNFTGMAVDISYDMLKSCDYYKGVFKKEKSPLRICCDANCLPFMNDSIPFVFCYETLHHFPDPFPITEEIHRVLLPGGYFFFDEEPFRTILHFNLYKGKKLYSKDSLNRSIIRKITDYFLSEPVCNEVEHGIIENSRISISDWKRALSFFEKKDVKLNSLKLIDSELFNPKHYIKFLLSYLFGGEISGICKKSGLYINKETSVYDALICPGCKENENISKLVQDNSSFLCGVCGNKFPIIDGVTFLFSPKKFKELYPEVFEKFCK